MKDSFVLFKQHYSLIQELSIEQRGTLLTAIYEWQLSGEIPCFDDLLVKVVFVSMSQAITVAEKRYEEVCERRREAGKMGGRPKKSNGFFEKQPKAKKANGFFEKQPKANESNQKQPKANESIRLDKSRLDIKEKDIPNGISKKKAQDEEFLEQQFCEFWEHYPRKVGRKTARRAFERALQKVSLEALVDAVEQQKCGSQWTKDNGEFIPHPTTWLNGERWLDAVEKRGIDHERTVKRDDGQGAFNEYNNFV